MNEGLATAASCVADLADLDLEVSASGAGFAAAAAASDAASAAGFEKDAYFAARSASFLMCKWCLIDKKVHLKTVDKSHKDLR